MAAEPLEQGRMLFIPRQVYENRAYLWPRKMAGKDGVHIIASPRSLVAQLTGEDGKEVAQTPIKAVQLELF